MKPAALLLLQVERETQAGGINPTLAGLIQSPYSLLTRQGICDVSQARSVRNVSKAVALLGKLDSGFACLAGHVFMTVQDQLGGEGRMPAELDGDVAPLRIENVERVVVHIGHRLLSFDVMVGADVPHRRLGAAH
jgi:hypothetical protein